MVEKLLLRCQGCPLHKQSFPVCSSLVKSDVLWLGISAQKSKAYLVFQPLDSCSMSGKFIDDIEKSLEEFSF